MPPFTRVDEVEPFQQALARGEIQYQHCNACGRAIFYPRTFCPYCMAGEDQIEWRQAAGGGSLYTYATIHLAPSEEFADRVPYTVGYVEMDEGFYLYGEVEGTEEELTIGQPVEATVVTRGDTNLIRFSPRSAV
jgi:uncharacterized OB-fold protein